MSFNNYALTLILGGAASGKSSAAEKFVSQYGSKVLYIATGSSSDYEMSKKIAIHRKRRPKKWKTAEIKPGDDWKVNQDIMKNVDAVLIDSLGTWISGQIVYGKSQTQKKSITGTIKFIESLLKSCPVVIVSEEVGMGLVPVSSLSRDFREDMGHINEVIAKIADEVYFIAAGMKLRIKPEICG